MNIEQILTSKFIKHTGNKDTYVVGHPVIFPSFNAENKPEYYMPYASLTTNQSTLYFRKVSDFGKFVHAEFNISEFKSPRFSIDLNDFETFKVRDLDGNWSEIKKEVITFASKLA